MGNGAMLRHLRSPRRPGDGSASSSAGTPVSGRTNEEARCNIESSRGTDVGAARVLCPQCSISALQYGIVALSCAACGSGATSSPNSSASSSAGPAPAKVQSCPRLQKTESAVDSDVPEQVYPFQERAPSKASIVSDSDNPLLGPSRDEVSSCKQSPLEELPCKQAPPDDPLFKQAQPSTPRSFRSNSSGMPPIQAKPPTGPRARTTLKPSPPAGAPFQEDTFVRRASVSSTAPARSQAWCGAPTPNAESQPCPSASASPAPRQCRPSSAPRVRTSVTAPCFSEPQPSNGSCSPPPNTINAPPPSNCSRSPPPGPAAPFSRCSRSPPSMVRAGMEIGTSQRAARSSRPPSSFESAGNGEHGGSHLHFKISSAAKSLLEEFSDGPSSARVLHHSRPSSASAKTRCSVDGAGGVDVGASPFPARSSSVSDKMSSLFDEFCRADAKSSRCPAGPSSESSSASWKTSAACEGHGGAEPEVRRRPVRPSSASARLSSVFEEFSHGDAQASQGPAGPSSSSKTRGTADGSRVDPGGNASSASAKPQPVTSCTSSTGSSPQHPSKLPFPSYRGNRPPSPSKRGSSPPSPKPAERRPSRRQTSLPPRPQSPSPRASQAPMPPRALGSNPTRASALLCLGLTGNPSGEEIRRAYKQAAMVWHPDRPQNRGWEEEAKRHFQEIKTAFDFLHAPDRRLTAVGGG